MTFNHSRGISFQLNFTLQVGLEAIRILLLEGFNKSATFVNTNKPLEQIGWNYSLFKPFIDSKRTPFCSVSNYFINCLIHGAAFATVSTTNFLESFGWDSWRERPVAARDTSVIMLNSRQRVTSILNPINGNLIAFLSLPFLLDRNLLGIKLWSLNRPIKLVISPTRQQTSREKLRKTGIDKGELPCLST